MKKTLYMVVLSAITLTGCTIVRPVYQTAPPTEYNGPPQSYNPPQPDYNNQPGNNGYAEGSYTNNYPSYDNSPQTDQVFYDELSPYGTWIDYPGYGYVWSPGDVGNDFTPYATNGYWLYSDYGWTWTSNYSWGWAPFHYGRWFYDNDYGWMWVPGNEWAPAWVAWGTYGDYYCWAPLAPRVDINTVSFHGGWIPPANSWSVVQRNHIDRRDVNNYIVKTNATVINNITHNVTVINNVNNNSNHRGAGDVVVYNRGPRVNDVENITNTKIKPVSVNDNVKPAGAQILSGNQLLIYRPQIKPAKDQGSAKPVPHKAEAYRQSVGNRGQQNQQVRPGVNQNPQNPNPRPGNPQQNPQVRPDVNQNPQNPNPRPGNPQQNPQVRPDVNQNPQNPNPRPGNPQQNPQVRPDVNQNPQNPNPRPGNPQQNPQVRPDVSQNPQNPNPRQGNPQQNPQVRPDVNQNPQNPNPRQGNPQQNPQVRPDVNQNPRNSNQQELQKKLMMDKKMKEQQNGKRRVDSLRKVNLK